MNWLLRRKSFAVFIVACLAGLFANAAYSATASAKIDRTVINEGESFTLTIRVDGKGSSGQPDYKPLQKDFEIYSTGSSSQSGFTGGQFYSLTEWQATLMPKRSGQLQIPPLDAGGAKTQPITIQVNPASSAGDPDSSEPVFLEVQTDRRDVYVQQQILLTVRVYIGVQLDNLQLSKPEFDNATAQQIGETTFNRNVNGVPYEVHELTYAIFPQQAGELTIPELVFSAVEASSHSLFDFPGRGRPLRKMSKQLSVHVKPIPNNFSGPVWLPARNLTLAESWSGDKHRLNAGDSITRTITINADNLMAAQLPKLDAPQLDSAKLYADQAKLDNKYDAAGVHGKRVENAALIPTRAGSIQLPETRVVWWDVDSDSEKVATLPGETFTVGPNAGATNAPSSTQSVASGQNTSAPTALSDTRSAADVQSASRAQSAPNKPATSNDQAALNTSAANKIVRGWQIAAGILAFLWLVTLFAYWRARRHAHYRTVIDDGSVAADIDEQNAWREFTTACRANNPVLARQKLLQWSSRFFRESLPAQHEPMRSLEQLKRMVDDQTLTRELQLLDNRLFGTKRDSGEWNGENLLRVVQEIKKRKPRKNTLGHTALPPLYPAA